MRSIWFSELHEDEAKALLAQKPVLLLPTGATEVHGAHLPLSTDTLLAAGVAQKVAEKLPLCSILPPVPYGQVWSLRDFPGSIDIQSDTYARFIADIGRSMDRFGVEKLAVINGHVGNMAALKIASRILWEDCAIKMYSFTYPGAGPKIKEVCESPRPHESYFHACEIETSYMLYLASRHVDMEKAIRNYPDFPPDFDVAPFPWSRVMTTAVMGDATLATAQKGEVIIDAVVDNIVHTLQTT